MPAIEIAFCTWFLYGGMTIRTISYTEVRANLSKTIDEVVDDIRPAVITKRNKRVVLISEDEYNALTEAFHVLRGGNAEYLREARP